MRLLIIIAPPLQTILSFFNNFAPVLCVQSFIHRGRDSEPEIDHTGRLHSLLEGSSEAGDGACLGFTVLSQLLSITDIFLMVKEQREILYCC